MKLMGFLIGASIALNSYVLWRLDEQSVALPVALSNFEVPAQAKPSTSSETTNRDQQEVIALLITQITELKSRLKSVEESYEALATRDDKATLPPEQYSQTTSLIDSIQSTNDASVDEDWFWSQKSTDNDMSLAFNPTEGLAVNSVVCRAQWCRVEVEDTSDESNDLVSGLELQLKIDKSLGRNTIIQSGEKNGRHRVLFIQ